MNIKEMSDLLKKGAMGDIGADEIDAIKETLSSCFDQSKKIVLESISEEDFVRLCRMVKASILATILSGGSGKTLMHAEMADELDGLLDTYFLSILGILMQEEIV